MSGLRQDGMIVQGAIAPTSAEPTMSSREIADLTTKLHSNVKQCMQALSAKGLIRFDETHQKGDNGGRPSVLYHVNQRDSYIVVAQLSPEFTARLVDRWQQLEKQVAHPPAIDLSNPSSLRALLLGYTERVLELEAAVAEQAPKVEAHDRIAGADGLSTVTVAAKDLQVGEGCKAASDGRLRVVSLVRLWHTASAVFRNHSDVVIL